MLIYINISGHICAWFLAYTNANSVTRLNIFRRTVWTFRTVCVFMCGSVKHIPHVVWISLSCRHIWKSPVFPMWKKRGQVYFVHLMCCSSGCCVCVRAWWSPFPAEWNFCPEPRMADRKGSSYGIDVTSCFVLHYFTGAWECQREKHGCFWHVLSLRWDVLS